MNKEEKDRFDAKFKYISELSADSVIASYKQIVAELAVHHNMQKNEVNPQLVLGLLGASNGRFKDIFHSYAAEGL